MKIQTFDYSVDLLSSVLWQYDEATNLLSLINAKQDWYTANQSQFWSDWYTNVFNLLTANTFGLSVWSYILNMPLYLLNEAESPSKPIWGFNKIVGAWPTLENTYLNFGHSNFSLKGTVITLSVEEQRFLLRLRYYQLSNRCDVTDINKFLNYLCSTSNIGYGGTIYILDNFDMSINYTFSASGFPPNLLSIIEDFDVLPRPAGVAISYTIP